METFARGNSVRLPVAAVLLGSAGGAALVTTFMVAHKGQWIYLPYALIVVATALYLRRQTGTRYAGRFLFSVAAFMLASVVAYVYGITTLNPNALHMSFWAHAWRLGFFLAVASVISAIVAKISGLASTGATAL